MPLFAPFEPHVRGRTDPGVTIRVATRADQAAVSTVAGCRGPLPPGFAERVAAWVDDPGRRLVVGELDGVVVGWGMVAHWDHDDVPRGHYVSALTVIPEARRRGVAGGMLAELCGWTWERDDVVRSVVNARNEASLAVHVRFGFTEVGRAAAYCGIRFEGGEGVLLRAVRSEEDV